MPGDGETSTRVHVDPAERDRDGKTRFESEPATSSGRSH